MDKLQRLAAWKNAAIAAVRAAGRGDASEFGSDPWTTEDDLFGFFDAFRPDGVGVEQVFAGVVKGEEILARLRRVFDCTRDGFGWLSYFIVKKPMPASSQRLIQLASQHLHSVRQIALSYRPELKESQQIHESVIEGAKELAAMLEPLPKIQIRYEPVPVQNPPGDSSPETIV